MSFVIEFVAATRAAAKAHLLRQDAPAAVKAFLCAAIDGIERALGDSLILVRATGHLCADLQSCEVSTAVLEVRPVPLAAPVGAGAAAPPLDDPLLTLAAE